MMIREIIGLWLLAVCSLCEAQAVQPVKKDFNYFFQTAVYDENLIPEYTLPDPLCYLDGSIVTTVTEWEQKRRPELMEMLTTYMYGRVPKAANQPFPHRVEVVEHNAFWGKAVRKSIKICMTDDIDGPSFNLQLFLPNAAKGKMPVILGLSFKRNEQIENATEWPLKKLLGSGVGLATFYYQDVCPDNPNTTLALGAEGAKPVYLLYQKDGIAYHTRAGGHTVLPYDWDQFLSWLESNIFLLKATR